MDAKKVNRAWAGSLIVIGASTIILVVARLIDAQLPDTAVRMIGALDLLALPVLAFSAVRKMGHRGRQSK